MFRNWLTTTEPAPLLASKIKSWDYAKMVANA